MIVILRVLKGVLHALDVWGEPVAPLNMKGQTVYTTSAGGLVGMVIAALLVWFTQTKIMKMVNRNDPFFNYID
jgi:hypothetical protein